MKNKVYIIFCLLFIPLEVYFIITNYSKGYPFVVNVLLLVGFLAVLYLLSGKENRDAK